MFKNFKFSFKKKRPAGLGAKIPAGDNHDPVCGMLATGDFFVINYQEQDYYFCSEYCKVKFIAGPSSYVK